ncbi:MAG: hemerythrin domain-containing protein [Lautropia sp.]
MGDSLERAVAWDLYRVIHKAMRFALCGVTTLAGSTDAADDGAVGRLVDEWRDVRRVLAGHHRNEDRFCDPLIAIHAPDLVASLAAEHALVDAQLARLDLQVIAMTAMPSTARDAALHRFHLDAADFTATYLRHLRFEEGEVMPALNRAMDVDALARLTQRIRASVAPSDMVVFFRYMVPSMNLDERVDLLGAMLRTVPSDVFERLRRVAQDRLSAADYAVVARRAGFD